MPRSLYARGGPRAAEWMVDTLKMIFVQEKQETDNCEKEAKEVVLLTLFSAEAVRREEYEISGKKKSAAQKGRNN